MALLFCDGYDHYATAQVVSGQKWDAVSNATISATYARSGGQGARVTNGYLNKNVPTASTYIIGTAIKGASYGSANSPVLSFQDGTTVQVSINVNPAGSITVNRNGTLLATATPTLPAGQYRYLEAKAFIDPTVGTVTVRLDGVVIISFTGNTRTTSLSQINNVTLGSVSLNTEFWYDDTYVCDTTTPNSVGNNNSDFLGDVKVNAIYPNAAGAFTQYTRGGTNTGNDYSQVNEVTPPDEDTTYIVDSTVNDRDSFKFPSLTVVGAIFGAVVWSRARKDDASVRTLANVARSGAVDTVGTSYNLAAAYQYYGTVFELDPATNALWTPAGINLAEFGVKTIA